MNDSLFKPVIGALPYQVIKQLFNERFIGNALPDNIRPSSLDIRILPEDIYEIPWAFMPSKNKQSIHQTILSSGAKKVGQKNGMIISRKPNTVYVAKVIETINFSQAPGLFGRAESKSTSGRTFLHNQLMADYTTSYDTIMPGSNGDLYVMFRPKSFPQEFIDELPISLNQIRFFKGGRDFLSGDELRHEIAARAMLNNYRRKTELHFSDVIRDDSFVELSLSLRGPDGTLGFVSKKEFPRPMIWKEKANKWEDFFEPIPNVVGDNSIILEEGRCYILTSREGVHVPLDYACQMVPFADALGQFRAHFAGFIDNGWGSKNGPRPLTLELIANENMRVYHGQPITYLTFDKMYAPVAEGHGYDDKNSNYKTQKDALMAKFFM